MASVFSTASIAKTREDLVDIVLGRTRESSDINLEANFVNTCKLCHPAFEAFRLYRQRDDFYGLKGAHNTFGSGPSEAVRRALKGENAVFRRAALRSLIEKWVGQRLN